MADISTEAVSAVLREAAGDDDSMDFGAESFERSFADLGFDSLALLEIAALVKREFGVVLTDEEMQGVETPADLVAKIDAARTAAAAS
jgi:act minimal PKS acyl carrier protein